MRVSLEHEVDISIGERSIVIGILGASRYHNEIAARNGIYDRKTALVSVVNGVHDKIAPLLVSQPRRLILDKRGERAARGKFKPRLKIARNGTQTLSDCSDNADFDTVPFYRGRCPTVVDRFSVISYVNCKEREFGKLAVGL